MASAKHGFLSQENEGAVPAHCTTHLCMGYGQGLRQWQHTVTDLRTSHVKHRASSLWGTKD